MTTKCKQCEEYERFVKWLNTVMPSASCHFESFKACIKKIEESEKYVKKMQKKWEKREKSRK